VDRRGGDGLVKPLNAPPAGALVPGVQPGASPSVITAAVLRAVQSVTGGSWAGTYVITIASVTDGGLVLPAMSFQNTSDPALLAPYVAGATSAAGGSVAAVQSGLRTAGDREAGVFVFAASANGGVNSQVDLAGDEVKLLAPGFKLFTSAGNLAVSAPAVFLPPVVSSLQVVQPGTASTAETWHAVTVPAGMTGTIRVKISAADNVALLDINTVITSTNAAPTTYTAGSLPSAAYYPLAARQFPVSVNQQWSTVANASPRVSIPTSGAVSLPLPGFVTAGASCVVSGLVMYPLD